MRHRLQSRQVVIGLALAGLMGAALCVVVVLVITGPLSRVFAARHATVFTHHVDPSVPPLALGRRAVLVSAGFLAGLLGYVVAATLAINTLFRRTSAGEAFFLLSYVLSLSLEVVRLLVVAFAQAGSASALTVLATRVVYMGRLFGLASLFFAALCSLGMRYADYAVLSGTSLLLAVAMGTIAPIDSSCLTTGFVHAVSDGGGLLSVGATAAFVVAAGSLLAPIVRGERHLVGYAVGMVCLLAGRELGALGAAWASAAGILLLVGGTYLAARALERVYLGIP